MTLLDVGIVNVAPPSVQNGLHASAGSVRWIVSGYAPTFGLAPVPGGRLGDVLGRRVMFLVALTAAGLLSPQNSGLIQDLFRGVERGRAFSLLGAVIGISTATGPVLGGLILAVFGDETGWRRVFSVNVPVGVLAFELALRWLPKGSVAAHCGARSTTSARSSLVSRCSPCCCRSWRRQSGGGRLWLLAVLAPVFGVLFVQWERRVRLRGGNPLLDPRLFTEVSGYSSGLLLGSAYFCGFAGIFLVMSLFLQKGLHYTPLRSGLTVSPFAVGSSIMAAVAGRLVSRLGRKLTVVRLGLITIGLATVAVVVRLTPQDVIGGAIAVPLLLAGIGGGAVISPNTTSTLECVPNRIAGVAGGALQTGQRIGTAVYELRRTTVGRAEARPSAGD